jgi:regulator of protease activity HflC (stomatin/prohibitin superfamily)
MLHQNAATVSAAAAGGAAVPPNTMSRSRRIGRRIREHFAHLLIAILLLAILVIVLAPRIIVTVRSGEAGVLFHRFTGTELTRIYTEGLYVIFPWDTMAVYNVRLQTHEMTFRMLTSTGLPVELRVAVRYQADVRLLPQLHVQVGPDYLHKVVVPEVESVLRRHVGQYSPEEIYTTKRGLLDSIVINSITAAEKRYVNIDDVLIKMVTLPQAVTDAIERKEVYDQQEKEYVYRLAIERKEAERKHIEANGIRTYQSIIKETLDEQLLRWHGILATRDLATSQNAKMVVIGSGGNQLPIILGSPGQ